MEIQLDVLNYCLHLRLVWFINFDAHVFLFASSTMMYKVFIFFRGVSMLKYPNPAVDYFEYCSCLPYIVYIIVLYIYPITEFDKNFFWLFVAAKLSDDIWISAAKWLGNGEFEDWWSTTSCHPWPSGNSKFYIKLVILTAVEINRPVSNEQCILSWALSIFVWQLLLVSA